MSALLAFLKRALREHSRSGALIVARVALALALVACLILFGSSRLMFGAAGRQFFSAVITVNALVITAGGCAYFASAIAEEKEDGTLSLLRMARVSPLALLLGKGGARLLDGLLLLAVQIPFTLVGITLGGVTPVQVAAAYVALGAYLVLLCAGGLLAGVLMDRTMKAAIFTGALVWLLLYGGGLVGWRTLDVFARLRAIVETSFHGPVFGAQVALSLILAAIFLVAAWALFDRFCSESGTGQPRPGSRADARRRRLEVRAPVDGALQWKDRHFLHAAGATRQWRVAAYGIAFLWLGADFLTGGTGKGR